MKKILLENKPLILSLILLFFLLSFSVPSQSAGYGSGCHRDGLVLGFFKNFLGLPVKAQTCEWTSNSICKNSNTVETTFSWPSAFTTGPGLGNWYNLYINGTLQVSGTFNTSEKVSLSPNNPYAWSVVAHNSSNQDLNPAPPGPQPFVTTRCASATCIGSQCVSSSPPGSSSPYSAPQGFIASPTTILPGESSTLSWSTVDATACSINQGIGAIAVSGSVEVTLMRTTTYTLTCEGIGGTISAQATVTVKRSPQFREIIPQ